MLSAMLAKMRNHKTIMKNIYSLGFLQIVKYIVPLISIPYVLRVLGPEKSGIIAFASGFVAYFALIVGYGFNLTITREISAKREDKQKISEVFRNITTLQFVLFFLSALVFLPIISSFSLFRGEYVVFIISFIALLGDVLYPIWLFQGMEKMKYITIINVIVRVLMLFSIFIWIKAPADYVNLAIIYAGAAILSGVIAFFVAINVFKIYFVMPSITCMKQYLKDSWYVFSSDLFMSLYSTTTPFLLGLLTNTTTVGYYDAVMKIIKAIKEGLWSIIQAIYPAIAPKLLRSKENTISFISKIQVLFLISTGVVGILLFVFAKPIILTLFGGLFGESIVLLKIFAFLPCCIAMIYVAGALVMLNFGFQKQFSYITIIASLISVGTAIVFTLLWGGAGMSISVLLTEVGIAIATYIFLRKNGINLYAFSSAFNSKPKGNS